MIRSIAIWLSISLKKFSTGRLQRIRIWRTVFLFCLKLASPLSFSLALILSLYLAYMHRWIQIIAFHVNSTVKAGVILRILRDCTSHGRKSLFFIGRPKKTKIVEFQPTWLNSWPGGWGAYERFSDNELHLLLLLANLKKTRGRGVQIRKL